MFRIIKELRPTWVVGENVANFANMELTSRYLTWKAQVKKGNRLLYRLAPSTKEERRAKKQYVRLGNTVSSLEGIRVGGQLNPTWVEWLMVFPTWWTELKD